MTRTFLRVFLAASVASVGAVASAGDVIGVRLKIGYHFTNKFELRNDSRGTLEGPEVAAEFPLSRFPGIQILATPSVCFGGKLSNGRDVDGTIYRFMVTARQTLTRDGLYGAVGVGAAHSESRGKSEFRGANGFVSSISLGSPLKFKVLGITPALEGTYYFSGKDQFRGITIGIAASF